MVAHQIVGKGALCPSTMNKLRLVAVPYVDTEKLSNSLHNFITQ